MRFTLIFNSRTFSSLSRSFLGLDRKSLLRQCYGKYGCFSVDYPWWSSHRIMNLFPESPREIRPYFFLYTRRNPNSMQLLSDGNHHALRGSNFDSRK